MKNYNLSHGNRKESEKHIYEKGIMRYFCFNSDRIIVFM